MTVLQMVCLHHSMHFLFSTWVQPVGPRRFEQKCYHERHSRQAPSDEVVVASIKELLRGSTLVGHPRLGV